MQNTQKTMEKLVAFCKGRGFVYSGSEIYGGLANAWDYGPLGVELKNNIKRAWLRKFVQESGYNVGLDSAILMNREVWVASGHVVNFNDPLIDCRACKMRYRADQLIEAWNKDHGIDMCLDGMTGDELSAYITEHGVTCSCGKCDFTPIRKFNMMFKTHQGVTEDSQAEVYLRPETAQGIFVNFKNIQRTTRRKLPFGVAQVGKSFRNEITPGNFIFRIREFEQMELEFFCKPGTRILLLGMDDSYHSVPPGTRGTVDHVDDGGTIHMKWDNGSGLGICTEVDSFRTLTAAELAEEQVQQENPAEDEDQNEGEAPVMSM